MFNMFGLSTLAWFEPTSRTVIREAQWDDELETAITRSEQNMDKMLQEATFLFDLTEVQSNPWPSTVQRPHKNDEDKALDKSALSSLRGTKPRRDTQLTINESDQTVVSSRSPRETPHGSCNPASVTPSQLSQKSYHSAVSLKLLQTVTEC